MICRVGRKQVPKHMRGGNIDPFRSSLFDQNAAVKRVSEQDLEGLRQAGEGRHAWTNGYIPPASLGRRCLRAMIFKEAGVFFDEAVRTLLQSVSQRNN